MYKTTPPEARGVGAYSKLYPGMFGLKSKFFPLIILVSETPIMLKSKFNSSHKWTWKFSKFRVRLLTLLRRTENPGLKNHLPSAPAHSEREQGLAPF